MKKVFVWFFNICELQFRIVREVLLPRGFGFDFAVSWPIATFEFDLCLSLWFECNLYLVFVKLWFLSLYL